MSEFGPPTDVFPLPFDSAGHEALVSIDYALGQATIEVKSAEALVRGLRLGLVMRLWNVCHIRLDDHRIQDNAAADLAYDRIVVVRESAIIRRLRDDGDLLPDEEFAHILLAVDGGPALSAVCERYDRPRPIRDDD